MSQTIPEDRIRIFNRSGAPLAEFSADVSRSWAIAKEGRASFSYPTRLSNIVNRDVLQFGNYLLVENSVLPAWVGVIDSPREWNKNAVTVNAFAPERLFKYRIGANGERTITGAAGTIFAEMIRTINAAERTILTTGEVWEGGAARQETLTPATLEKNLRQLQSRSLEEYDFTPIIINGRLVIRGNWKKLLGQVTNLTLLQGDAGGNVEEPKAKEDSAIVNEVYGYGEGLTWSSKPQSSNKNDTSAATYGLRQASQEWSGVTSATTVQSNNLNLLKKTHYPKWIMSLTALNVGDTFRMIQLGNYFNLSLEGIGFGGNSVGIKMKSRIMAMSYDPQMPNKIKLVMTEEY